MTFWKFGKQKKEVADMASTDEKEIRKARENIERKGTDSQTERDREDESVAAQKRKMRCGFRDGKRPYRESEGASGADEKRGAGDGKDEKLFMGFEQQTPFKLGGNFNDDKSI